MSHFPSPDHLLKDLNSPQKEAVVHRGGPLMVLAGAGSGKTRVITYRIAHLLSTGEARPWNILAVTFTNKAAREMRERVWGLLGRSEKDLWVSTFHSACARILRGHAHLLGYRPDFAIFDDRDQLGLVEECCKELNLDLQRFPPRMFLSRISAAKQLYRSPDEVLQEAAGDYLQEKVGMVYHSYQGHLRQSQAMDFDDLLYNVLQLFDRHREVLGYYSERWLHVLVDEFQDTNNIQYRLVKALAERHRNLCVVGDDDQSIYSWRGADLGNILGFDRDFPDAKVIRLEQNYRSTKRIIQASGAVIAKNVSRKGKMLWTENELGEPIFVCRALDERDEAAFVADEVQNLIQRHGFQAGDVAVFYRTHAQSRVLEEELLSRRVAFSIYGGVGFYERKEIKDVVAYLRALAHSSDDLSWKRILNTPRRGIGRATQDAVTSLARSEGIPFSEALRRFAGQRGRSRGASARIQAFIELMDGLKARMADMGVKELVEAVLWESGYLDELRNEATPQAREREENLQELLNLVAEFEGDPQGDGLTGFLERVALVSDIDRMDSKSDMVSLMTIHSAKGLEFPVVFLVGMEEQLLPHSSSLQNEADLEEERRLCYVAMTRARKRLYLCHAATRRIWGSTRQMKPSRFLKDLPVESIRGLSLRGIDLGESSEAMEGPGIFIGRWVRHRSFGVGTVRRVEQEGARVVIHFPGVGERRFVTDWAPLEWL